MSLWNLGSATAKIVGENASSVWEDLGNTDREPMNCGCDVSRQKPAGFKPVIETETENGGTFYQFNNNNYETIKGELKPSFWSIFNWDL